MSSVQPRLIEPARAPDLAPERECLPELDADLSPSFRAPARVQHHAQDAGDAESRVSEACFGSGRSLLESVRCMRMLCDILLKERLLSAYNPRAATHLDG
jgi:hypothetical protein